ncbi:MAG TPA: hypothetical protein VF516_00155 [Kofleriaceae bacterium]
MGKLLVVRKRADRTGPEPAPGQPWPLLGVELVDAPDTCRVPTNWVNKAVAEGWAELVGPAVVMRPGGPASDPASVLHQFLHAEALRIHTLDGPVTYRITRQPDKYVAGGADDEPVTAEAYAAGDTQVDHWYELEREV